MTTLISKEKNLYMVFNTRHEALDFAWNNLTKNICKDIITKRDDWFWYTKRKSNGDRLFVDVCVYEHRTKWFII